MINTHRISQACNYHVTEVALAILGIATLAFGIWQLHQPFLSNYSAAAWGFISLGALLTSSAIVWRIVSNFKQRIQPSESKLKSSNVPDKIEISGREIALGIFKSILLPCLDNKTLMNLKNVNSSFYHAVSDYIESNKALKSFICSQKFIFALKNLHPLSFFSKLATKLNIATIKGHTQTVTSVYYRDGILFSGSFDEKVKVWLRENGKWKCIESLEHKGGVNSVYYRDGMLFSGLCNKLVQIWQNEHGKWKCIATLNEHKDWVSSVYYRDGMLFSGSWDNRVKVWQKENGIWKCTATLEHNESVSSVYYRDGILFSGSLDHKIKIWQKEHNKWKCTVSLIKDVVSLYYKDSLLFCGSSKGEIYILRNEFSWRIRNNEWQEINTLIGHNNRVTSLYYRDGMLFSGSNDKTVRIWQYENMKWKCWKCIATLKGHNDYVCSISYGEGKLFSGSSDNKIKAYQV